MRQTSRTAFLSPFLLSQASLARPSLELSQTFFDTQRVRDNEKKMADLEKRSSASSTLEKDVNVKETMEENSPYNRQELMDPSKEETLQRGLSARQISMIAVCPS